MSSHFCHCEVLRCTVRIHFSYKQGHGYWRGTPSGPLRPSGRAPFQTFSDDSPLCVALITWFAQSGRLGVGAFPLVFAPHPLGCICPSLSSCLTGQELGKAGREPLHGMRDGVHGFCAIGLFGLWSSILTHGPSGHPRPAMVGLSVSFVRELFSFIGLAHTWYGAITLGRAWLDHIMVEQMYRCPGPFSCMAALCFGRLRPIYFPGISARCRFN